MYLGKGSYGEVQAIAGEAVKSFKDLPSMVQEYVALRHLRDTQYIVHINHGDLVNRQIFMELYDCCLRNWIETVDHDKPKYHDDTMKILHDVLQGLVELHDRGLIHGDLKPGNILLRLSPLGAVLGDCGFVSVYKYAKVEHTAPVYRDSSTRRDIHHDMYSLGVCMLELLGNVKVNQQIDYQRMREGVWRNIHDTHMRDIICNLVSERREERRSARQLLDILYGTGVPVVQILTMDYDTILTTINGEECLVPAADRHSIRNVMQQHYEAGKCTRTKVGYCALIYYLHTHQISSREYSLYTSCTVFILTSLFGRARDPEQSIRRLNLDRLVDKRDIPRALIVIKRLTDDDHFIYLLLKAPYGSSS